MINCDSLKDVACSQIYNFKRQTARLIKCCIAARFLLKTKTLRNIKQTFSTVKNKISSLSPIDTILTECAKSQCVVDLKLRATETIDVLGNSAIITNGTLTSVHDYVAKINNNVCIFISKTTCFAFQSINTNDAGKYFKCELEKLTTILNATLKKKSQPAITKTNACRLYSVRRDRT